MAELLEDLGRELRAQREARGLSLREVQAETKIRSRYLEAIEAGDYSAFPGEVYARGFLRSYALFLGFDGDAVIERYRQAVAAAPQPAQPRGGGMLGHITLTQADEEVPPARAARGGRALRPRRASAAGARTAAALAVLVLAAVALYLIGLPRGPAPFPTGGRLAPPAGVPPADARGGTQAPATPPVSPPAPPQQPTLTRIPPPPQEPDLRAYEVRLPGDAEAMRLEVRTGVRCWYGVTVDGRFLEQGILEAGGRVSWQGTDEISVRLGNPADLRWTLNGGVGDHLRESSPVTLRLTRKR